VMSNASTQTRRRRLRFSLRTLLLLVAACAVATWFHLTGWPWLVACWQQVRFERAIRQLKVGATTYFERTSLPQAGHVTTTYTADDFGTPTGTTRYSLTNAVYFVHLRYPRDYQGGMFQCASTNVEVFRLPPVPPSYVAKRKMYDD